MGAGCEIAYKARLGELNKSLLQYAMQVSESRELPDPPLLRLENEAGSAYLSMLTVLYSDGLLNVKKGADVETRLLELCCTTINSFEVISKLLYSLKNISRLVLNFPI